MVESVIPGTYITVRAEGLISAGRISTGIVGIIGTASNGPVEEPVTLSGLSQARDIFGLSDPFNAPENGANPLTLMRSLEYVYGNGALSVVAVRVAGPSRSSSTYAVQDDQGRTVVVLTARAPGTWGNDISVQVSNAEDHCQIENETHTESFDRLNYVRVVPSPQNRIRIVRGITRRVDIPNLVYQQIVTNEEVTPNADNRFFLGRATAATPVEEVANVNLVRILDDAGALVREYGDGDILYGAGDPPGADEIRINTGTGEITFEATQVPQAGQGVVATYAIGHADPQPGEVLVTVWDGSLSFAAGEVPREADGDTLIASYLVDRENCREVRLTYEAAIERYIVPDGRELARRINATVGTSAPSLVTAEADETNGGNLPNTVGPEFFGTGSNTPGNNGAEAGRDEYRAGLESLANRLINIVMLAGQDVNTMGGILLGHLNATEQTDHERIGVIGAAGSAVANVVGHSMADDRVILVAPGLRVREGTAFVTLPPAYTAAAVVGLISSIPVQTSLTNKTLNVPGLAVEYNRGEQERLIRRSVLAVITRNGHRIVRGVTTEGEGNPFFAVPTRRIVDFAKYGVRSAANPYLGRLNNERVRTAMKATLDAFLTRMVESEALTAYELSVSATRAQEIAGEVSVVMTLQPTFSIEFIQVTMILR